MPSISTDNVEQSVKKMENHLEGLLGGSFNVVVGVNRKVNTGNYENIDVYVGVTVPVVNVEGKDLEELRAILGEAADIGIKFASEETYERYQAIKG